MRFLALLLVLTILGCTKDVPPPPPGLALQKQREKEREKNEAKAAQEEASGIGASAAEELSKDRTGNMKRSNPFLTLEEEKAFGAKNREVLTNIILSAIFSAAKGAYAIVDGKVLKLNDRIYGKTVVEINRNNVVLRDASREYMVNLRVK